MARIDLIEEKRRPVAAERLRALMERSHRAGLSSKPTMKSFSEELLLIDQSRFSHILNREERDYGTFDGRVALRAAAVDVRLRQGAGLGVHWWLATDVVISMWPDDQEREWLFASHPLIHFKEPENEQG